MSALRLKTAKRERKTAEQERIAASAGASGRKHSVLIGPIRISRVSRQDLIEDAVRHIFRGSSTTHIVTANAQFYVLAERNAHFRQCLTEADYICADGLPIVRMCNWMGATDIERITGIDLLPLLCERAADFGFPVYFLGGEPGSAAASASLLMDRYPNLQVCGVGCPPRDFENSSAIRTEVLRSIAAAAPAIIFVALGAPRQEYFIQQHIRPIGIPVAIGVGGSFEMLAGIRRRAPSWIQAVGMEWAFRLAQEPRRLAKRYLVGNSAFSYYALRYLFSEQALAARDAFHATLREAESQEPEQGTERNQQAG